MELRKCMQCVFVETVLNPADPPRIVPTTVCLKNPPSPVVIYNDDSYQILAAYPPVGHHTPSCSQWKERAGV